MEIKDSFVLDEGVDAFGTRTQIKFYSDQIQKIQTFDGNALADACTEERNATRGERWGEMRKVASIPMAVYGKALEIKDNRERIKYIKNWLRENSAFITFDKYLK